MSTAIEVAYDVACASAQTRKDDLKTQAEVDAYAIGFADAYRIAELQILRDLDFDLADSALN